eukprot:Sdes_comp10870_c0_seq1m2532
MYTREIFRKKLLTTLGKLYSVNPQVLNSCLHDTHRAKLTSLNLGKISGFSLHFQELKKLLPSQEFSENCGQDECNQHIIDRLKNISAHEPAIQDAILCGDSFKYLNFTLDHPTYCFGVLQDILEHKKSYGKTNAGMGKHIAVEY